MNWLLVLVPVSVALEFLAPDRHLLVFVASCLAILPLAAAMGRATEALADRLGEGIGGLLNATFGNAAELIIAFAALRAGLHDVVKASLGLSNVFVGVFVVAILGNAAEHATAISAALKDRMDLSLSIAIGSSVQVALFVGPVLVLASLLIGPSPLDLAFPAGLVLMVFLAVLIAGQIAGDGRSDWLKGAQLLAVYLVLGLTYFFIPGVSSH
jgi:Ca2+/H+ antiporter